MPVHRQKAGFKENCTEKKDTQLPPRGPMGLLTRRRGEKREKRWKKMETQKVRGGRRPGFPSSPSGHQRKHDSNRTHKSLGRARRAGPCLLHLRGEKKVNCPPCPAAGSPEPPLGAGARDLPCTPHAHVVDTWAQIKDVTPVKALPRARLRRANGNEGMAEGKGTRLRVGHVHGLTWT